MFSVIPIPAVRAAWQPAPIGAIGLALFLKTTGTTCHAKPLCGSTGFTQLIKHYQQIAHPVRTKSIQQIKSPFDDL